jgi:hypothetical protein
VYMAIMLMRLRHNLSLYIHNILNILVTKQLKVQYSVRLFLGQPQSNTCRNKLPKFVYMNEGFREKI